MNEREFSDRALRCANRLWRIAYLILRSESDCDDAVQEALLRAWSRLDSLREEALFETWLTRILINTARSMLRRSPKAELLADPPDLRCAEPPNPALRDAIRALDLHLRLPLVLHHVEGYSIAECATLLRLPATTVKWRLHTARKRLREALKEEYDA